MLFFVRTTKGLGNAGVYARLKNTSGQYWDFVSLSWVASESANTKLMLTENPDSDPLESLYMAESPIPSGGPWIEEAVHVSDGVVIAFDDNVMGELNVLPSSSSSLQEKIEFIYQYLAFKRTATSTLETMHKNDGTTALGTATLSDNGILFTKNKVE
jgi:hypothetical protein